ncbi:MAG TPA: putative Ig domain-containing protein, partial [Pyrinomonadaceae bacterium]|nr:putative Ig domain-containing protein [Pyrinomonadaceae bacterium]
FNASSALTGSDFWPTAGNGTRVRSLYHNTVPWQSFTDYQFTLQFRPGEIKIMVRQGAAVLADITVNDATYTNGLFGFYNYSQEQVRYSGFRRLSLAQATYTYDVEAFDPDGDAVTYSLTAAPVGMTINATSGLVNWPVTSRDAGDHTVTVRAQDPQGASDTQTFTLTILNQNQAPIVNAGADQTIAVNGTATLSGTVTDDGLPRNAAVTSSWSMVSGPGLVAFADASAPSTTATFSEAGTYVLRLTATDTVLTASDETVITVTPPNQAPSAGAGADQTVTLPGAARLNGTATDDGLPLGSTLAITWSQVSGPGTVTFADAASAVTTATFGVEGTYVLRLSASDTELTSTDDVTVTVNPVAPNAAPAVSAGADQAAELNSNQVRNGGNDEPLVGGEIRAWTEAVGNLWTRGVSGAGGFPESVNGDAFFYAGETASAELRQDVDVTAFAATINAGTQSFEWKAFVRSRAEAVPDTARVIVEYRNASNTAMIARLDSGEVASTSAWHLLEDTRPAPAGTGWIRIRLVATRRTGTTNDAYFDALSLRAVTGAGVKLAGTVTDDGLPFGGALTTGWTKVSGPGDVAFADASAASTTATFGAAGVYVLRLSASDSELTSGDELTVTVEPRNLAPVVEAGADQTVTLPATASLGGLVTDDGKPTGAAVTSNWTKVSGPGTVTFADASAPVTTATFGVEGTYVLRLSANDTEYGTSDTLTVTVNPEPANLAPTVNAGADQLVNPPATTATLSGTVTDDGKPTGGSLTYAWTKVSGPGNVTFGSPSALVTTAAFGEAGVYVLRLSANDTELTGSDDVRVTVNGTNKAPTVNAGADQTVAYPTTVTLTGTATDDGLPLDSTLSFTWSKLSGPGDVTFANANALQTTATFGAAGTYVLRLAASDTALAATDDVTVTQTGPPTASINSPAEGSTITGRTTFVGTVGEGSTWRLEYRLNEEGVAPVW